MSAFATPQVLRLSSFQTLSLSRCHTYRKLNAFYRSSTRATLAPDAETSSTSHLPVDSNLDQSTSSNQISIDEDTSAAIASINDLMSDHRQRIFNVKSLLEFWFSASNLRRDWYLRSRMDEQGWIPLSVFETFNRIKSEQATLDDLLLAARASPQIQISSLSDEKINIRKSPTVPDWADQYEDEVVSSVILKRLPPNVTIDDINDIIKPLAEPTYIRIYRTKDFPDIPRALVCFKDEETTNSVFERFSSEAPPQAQGVILRKRTQSANSVTLEAVAGKQGAASRRVPTIVLKATGIPSDIEWRQLYKDLKNALEESFQLPLRYMLYKEGDTFCNLTFTSIQENTERCRKLVEEGIVLPWGSASVSRIENQQDLKEYWERASHNYELRKQKRIEFETKGIYPQGVIARVTGIPEDAGWVTVRNTLRQVGRLLFLNYKVGDESCYARYGSSGATKQAIRNIYEKNISMGGKNLEAVVIEGEEEKQYWARISEQKQKEAEQAQSTNTDESSTE